MTDLGSVPGVQPQYGGLFILASDPASLYIGGDANGSLGALYRIALVRDGDDAITGFSGTAVRVADAPYNDGGITLDPGGHISYAQWPSNGYGQIDLATGTVVNQIDLTPLGVASASAMVAFIPAGFPGAGGMRIASWSGGEFYEVGYSVDPGGIIGITSVTPVPASTLPGGPEGWAYVPSGSPQFAAPSMIVSEYSSATVSVFEMDGTGNPVIATRRDFVTGLNGAEGAAFDPVSGAYLFSTFGGGDHVIVVEGFAAPTVANATLLPASLDFGDVAQGATSPAQGPHAVQHGHGTARDRGCGHSRRLVRSGQHVSGRVAGRKVSHPAKAAPSKSPALRMPLDRRLAVTTSQRTRARCSRPYNATASPAQQAPCHLRPSISAMYRKGRPVPGKSSRSRAPVPARCRSPVPLKTGAGTTPSAPARSVRRASRPARAARSRPPVRQTPSEGRPAATTSRRMPARCNPPCNATAFPAQRGTCRLRRSTSAMWRKGRPAPRKSSRSRAPAAVRCRSAVPVRAEAGTTSSARVRSVCQASLRARVARSTSPAHRTPRGLQAGSYSLVTDAGAFESAMQCSGIAIGPGQPAQPVPTRSPAGIAGLIALLALAGTMVARARRPAR